MRTYRVPILLNEEEKVFGGRLSLRQVAYLVAGLVFGLFLYYALRPAKPLAVGLAVIVLAAAASLALVELPGLGMGLDRYLMLRFRYLTGPRRFPYAGPHGPKN